MSSILGIQLDNLHLPSMINGDTVYTGEITLQDKEKQIQVASFSFNRVSFLLGEGERFKNGQDHIRIQWKNRTQQFEDKVMEYYSKHPNPSLSYYPDDFHMLLDELLLLAELEREYNSLSIAYQYVLFQFTLRRDIPYLYQEGKRDSYRIYFTNEKTDFEHLQDRMKSGNLSFLAVQSKQDFSLE